VKRAIIYSLALAITALAAPYARAQATDLSWHTIGCGGGTSTGGSISLSGTIGQPDAGNTLVGGAVSLKGGFWGGVTPVCQPDVTGDGQVNVQDFLAFLALYSGADPRADFTHDGVVNVADFLAFLSAYAAGCT
jgi:hypothetical protein